MEMEMEMEMGKEKGETFYFLIRHAWLQMLNCHRSWSNRSQHVQFSKAHFFPTFRAHLPRPRYQNQIVPNPSENGNGKHSIMENGNQACYVPAANIQWRMEKVARSLELEHSIIQIIKLSLYTYNTNIQYTILTV